MDEERQNKPEDQLVSPTPAPKMSRLAVASLVLGVLGICAYGITIFMQVPVWEGLELAVVAALLLCPPIGIALGIFAIAQIRRHPHEIRGIWYAIVGTTLSVVVSVPILAPLYIHIDPVGPRTMCLNNLKQMGVAIHLYSADWDDRFPLAGNWNDALLPYLRPNPNPVFLCPEAKPNDDKLPTYAINAFISGRRGDGFSDPADIVTVFECNPGRNMAGGPALLPVPPRHGDSQNFLFADGHTKSIGTTELSPMKWSPGVDVPSKAPISVERGGRHRLKTRKHEHG